MPSARHLLWLLRLIPLLLTGALPVTAGCNDATGTSTGPHCTTGCRCGNTCISCSKTCHV